MQKIHNCYQHVKKQVLNDVSKGFRSTNNILIIICLISALINKIKVNMWNVLVKSASLYFEKICITISKLYVSPLFICLWITGGTPL